ncbi:MAG TPA: SufS family cysteine desulfurase [Deltaproteobacteria bacterium]|nr:SufS family cysteine desulfurase [Deltaproteobacteria bacterium]HPJ93702.1 SufS family cysteine desulfurase [Deltaproteobacteria bacterium]
MTYDVDRVAAQFSILTRLVQDNPLHYLDNAATSQVPDCVIEAMVTHETTRRANVKRGVHLLSEEADEAYEEARAEVARYLGADCPDEVVFTSGATAGINLLALSLGQDMKPGDEVLISQLEHHSNIIPWQMLRQRTGITLRYLPVTRDGRIDLNDLERCITGNTRVVALTHGSNVTGAITNAGAIAALAHDRGARFMLDGAQTAPHGPLEVKALGADFYVFSSHKVYGPSGIGVIWGKQELLERMPPAFGGGEMIEHVDMETFTSMSPPHRFEAGTPPITQAVGLAAALKWLGAQDLEGIYRHLTYLTDQLIEGLEHMDRGRERIRILGPVRGEERLPLVSFSVDGIHPHDICQIMNDHHGVALRGGHHCAQPLHDLYGLDGTTRASLAVYTRKGDIDAFFEGMEHCLEMFT